METGVRCARYLMPGAEEHEKLYTMFGRSELFPESFVRRRKRISIILIRLADFS